MYKYLQLFEYISALCSPLLAIDSNNSYTQPFVTLNRLSNYLQVNETTHKALIWAIFQCTLRKSAP